MKEYYDRRPELVQTLKERQGKTRFWLLFELDYG
jgi:hypothetical protein